MILLFCLASNCLGPMAVASTGYIWYIYLIGYVHLEIPCVNRGCGDPLADKCPQLHSSMLFIMHQPSHPTNFASPGPFSPS